MVGARLLGVKGGQIRSQVLPHTDRRVKLIQELIASIFYIKLSVYEDFFAAKIFREREQEVKVNKAFRCVCWWWGVLFVRLVFSWFPHLQKLRRTGFVGAIASNLVTAASFFSAMTTILILIATNSTPLSASTAFTLLSLYFGIWLPLIMFNNAVSKRECEHGKAMTFFFKVARFGAAAPSFARLTQLLSYPTVTEQKNWDHNATESFVRAENAVFRYSVNKKSESELFQVSNVSFEAKAGQMVMICGVRCQSHDCFVLLFFCSIFLCFRVLEVEKQLC